MAGKILRVLFGDAQASRAMLLVQGETSQFKLQGPLTFTPEVGKRVSAMAVLEQHPKWGDQYGASFIIEELPIDRHGAVAYMASKLDGMSKVTAHLFYDVFGESIFEVLQNTPEKLVNVGGATEAAVKRISASWKADNALRNLWPFLSSHGVDGASVARIYARFGVKSMQVAKEQPYLLAMVDGVSFQSADSIAAECGVRADSDARAMAALEFALDQGAQNGHTGMATHDLVNHALRLLEMDGPEEASRIEIAVERLLESGTLVARVLDGRLCLSSSSFAAAEFAISSQVKRLVDAGGADEALARRARSKAEALKDADQANAVANVFMSPVSVITGRPGCGKSTVVKVIAEVAKEAKLKVVMVAPTGKAARRLKEATGEPSTTVHTLLGPELGSGMDAFQHGLNNPLHGDIFVVDESSMMDTSLMRAFLEALPSGARLVLVGDVDQLASVAAGKCLADLIASNVVPVAWLKTPHRTALGSDIVVNAHHIVNGDVEAVDLKGGKDFKFVPALDDGAIRTAVLKRYLEMVEQYGVDGVQILSARRGTPTGVDALNGLIRPVINPASPGKPEIEYRGRLLRLGDRVMRTSNNKVLGVSNGEVGVISHVDLDKSTVRVNFGDREVSHSAKELSALELSYAQTIHKSQGSEHPGVIMVVPADHRGMLNRNLIYTGLTRGKRESDIVGDASVLRASIKKLGANRCTGLAAELRIAFGEARPATTFTATTARPSAAPARPNPSASRHYQPPAPRAQGPSSGERSNMFRRSRP